MFSLFLCFERGEGVENTLLLSESSNPWSGKPVRNNKYYDKSFFSLIRDYFPTNEKVPVFSKTKMMDFEL